MRIEVHSLGEGGSLDADLSLEGDSAGDLVWEEDTVEVWDQEGEWDQEEE